MLDDRGRDRARYVMLRLLERAREKQVGVPALRSTDYINTIPPEREPWFPGDEEAERRIRAFIRWNAAVMVSSANRKGLEVGGHIATYQSSASLYEVGFNHFFRGKDHEGGGDQLYIQGHGSPGIYARAFLEGRLTEEQLYRFRQEVQHGKGAGLPSYPHPRLMPDFWEFPTVSMGLTAIGSIYQARFNRYLDNRGIKDTNAAARVGLHGRRRDGRARVARRDPRRGPRGARQPHLDHQLQPAAARRPGDRQRQDHAGARGQLPRRRLERHQGRLGSRVGRPARQGRRRRPGQPDELHARRPVPDLLDRGRRLRPRALLRRRPAPAQDGRAHVRLADREAAPRWPRLPQGLRRVRRRDQAHRSADGDPGPHHQGLDDRRPRGQERHPPDEEADPSRTSRSSATGSTCRSATATSRSPTRRPAARRSTTRAPTRPRSST